ncbi:MAG: hypothetical protein AB7E76_13700 [Deferribacterales bacterium]
MQLTGTLQSIIDFSNFFDQQLYVFCEGNGAFFSVKNGVYKQIKFPDHLRKLLADKYIMSKAISSGGEKSILYIYRLGDGHTLFLNDPGTGNVVNGFILSLITLSSNVCSVSPSQSDGDINQVLLDQLVAEFDREKKKFAVTDKRQKEEIIILEEQAKEAYNQMAELENTLKQKDAEIAKLKKSITDLAESYKSTEKKLASAHQTTDFQLGADLKKKNEELRNNNRMLVDLIKKNTSAIADLHSELEMYIEDFAGRTDITDEQHQELRSALADLFNTQQIES